MHTWGIKHCRQLTVSGGQKILARAYTNLPKHATWRNGPAVLATKLLLPVCIGFGIDVEAWRSGCLAKIPGWHIWFTAHTPHVSPNGEEHNKTHTQNAKITTLA
uniref:Uncharacterized protein n=1 Tax=Eutreptiella gymnastica TaxID=73025 RepID=A0A7S4FFH2_9EUGL